jgi:threonine aldolase
MIDLRSDTVTRPTPAMREAMLGAPVGDDGYGDDESVNALQEKAAELFGMEAALFCPSGTMTNQIGIKLHTQAGDEVICDRLSHIYLSEGGGIAANAGASVRLLAGDHGRFTAEQVRENINRRDAAQCPYSRLVVVENTVNHGGGSCWDLEEIRRIRRVCADEGLALHLDGARLFNALLARGGTPRQYGETFDTISICLSKGLGAPAGSLLLGNKAGMQRAHRIRRMMGGGMRQAGYLAAAGIYALDHHRDRLADDHAKAKALARELGSMRFVAFVLPADTNIVIFKLVPEVTPETMLAHLLQHDIRALKFGPQKIRVVFHLDIGNADFERLLAVLRAFPLSP